VANKIPDCFQIDIVVGRKPSKMMLNLVFPCIVAMFATLTCFTMDEMDLPNKLAVLATMFLSIVAFKLTVNEMTPEGPNPTPFDYFFALGITGLICQSIFLVMGHTTFFVGSVPGSHTVTTETPNGSISVDELTLTDASRNLSTISFFVTVLIYMISFIPLLIASRNRQQLEAEYCNDNNVTGKHSQVKVKQRQHPDKEVSEALQRVQSGPITDAAQIKDYIMNCCENPLCSKNSMQCHCTDKHSETVEFGHYVFPGVLPRSMLEMKFDVFDLRRRIYNDKTFWQPETQKSLGHRDEADKAIFEKYYQKAIPPTQPSTVDEQVLISNQGQSQHAGLAAIPPSARSPTQHEAPHLRDASREVTLFAPWQKQVAEGVHSLFSRYDFDGSGTINTEDELRMLTTNLCYQLKMNGLPADIEQQVRLAPSCMSQDAYVRWFCTSFSNL